MMNLLAASGWGAAVADGISGAAKAQMTNEHAEIGNRINILTLGAGRNQAGYTNIRPEAGKQHP